MVIRWPWHCCGVWLNRNLNPQVKTRQKYQLELDTGDRAWGVITQPLWIVTYQGEPCLVHWRRPPAYAPKFMPTVTGSRAHCESVRDELNTRFDTDQFGVARLVRSQASGDKYTHD